MIICALSSVKVTPLKYEKSKYGNLHAMALYLSFLFRHKGLLVACHGQLSARISPQSCKYLHSHSLSKSHAPSTKKALMQL